MPSPISDATPTRMMRYIVGRLLRAAFPQASCRLQAGAAYVIADDKAIHSAMRELLFAQSRTMLRRRRLPVAMSIACRCRGRCDADAIVVFDAPFQMKAGEMRSTRAAGASSPGRLSTFPGWAAFSMGHTGRFTPRRPATTAYQPPAAQVDFALVLTAADIATHFLAGRPARRPSLDALGFADYYHFSGCVITLR